MARAKRHGQRGKVPVEQLHVPLIAHGACVQHDWGALGVDDQIPVQPHPVIKQLVVESQWVFHAVRFALAPEAVQIRQNWVDHPQDAATVHGKLVQNDPVLATERLGGFGNDDQVVPVHAVPHAVELL